MVLEYANILWDFMKLGQEPRKADAIVGFGCYDEDIPRRCAQLYHQGFAPWVVFSGGLGRNTEGLFAVSEAERFGRIAEEEGVPKNRIILEKKSRNSAENLRFTPEIMAEYGVPAERIIAVHKPYMERRLWSAMQVYWPGVDAIYTSPQVDIMEHIAHAEQVGMTQRGVIETIVGDVQRMEAYPKLGYQAPVEIPERVWNAFQALVELGYTGQMIKE